LGSAIDSPSDALELIVLHLRRILDSIRIRLVESMIDFVSDATVTIYRLLVREQFPVQISHKSECEVSPLFVEVGFMSLRFGHTIHSSSIVTFTRTAR
jgi:hypothetical protein